MFLVLLCSRNLTEIILGDKFFTMRIFLGISAVDYYRLCSVSSKIGLCLEMSLTKNKALFLEIR